MRFVLYILIGSGLIYIGANSDRLKSDNDQPPTPEVREPILFSVYDKPFQCSYMQDDEVGYMQGKLYIDRTRMSNNLTSFSGGQMYATGMYSDGVSMYVWSGVAEKQTGAVYAVTDNFVEPLSFVDDAGELRTLPFSASVDGIEYDCSEWDVDETMFTIPDRVPFFDMHSIQAQSGESTFDNSRSEVPPPPGSAVQYE